MAVALLGVEGRWRRAHLVIALLALFLPLGISEFAFLVAPVPVFSTSFSSNFKVDCRTNDINATANLIYRKSPSVGWKVMSQQPGKVLRNGDVFTVINIQLSDSGFYQCRATNQTGRILTWPIVFYGRLSIQSGIPPNVAIEPAVAAHSIGASFNFTCTSYLQTNIKWLRRLPSGSETNVPESQTHSYSDQNKNEKYLVLMIKNAQLSDTATYKCVVSRGISSNFRLVSAYIFERKKPDLTSRSTDFTVPERSTREIFCAAKAYPHIQSFKWYINGKEISVVGCTVSEVLPCEDSEYKMKLKSTTTTPAVVTTSLTIKNMKLPEDHGTYICVARNSIGVASASIFINVEGKPVISEERSTVLQFKDRPAQVPCKILNSNPPAKFTWEYQFLDPLCSSACSPIKSKWRPLASAVYSVRPDTNVATNVSTVSIPANQDPGYFRCIATNTMGSSNWTVTYLHLDDPGKDYVNIKYPSKVSRVDEWDSIRIECIVYKQLITTNGVEVLHGKQVISMAVDSRVNITKTQLNAKFYSLLVTISNATLNDSGVYTCDAVGLKPQRSINDTVKITVLALKRPTISGLESKVIKEEDGTNVELICQTTGHPKPVVKWFKHDAGNWRIISDIQILTGADGCSRSKSNFFYYYQGREGSPLVICKPEYDLEHSGTYKCEATNSQGFAFKTATLDVQEGAHIISPKSGTISFARGTPLNRTCLADGNPMPMVKWTTTVASKVKVLAEGRKEAFLQVDAIEEGVTNYTCTASNYKSATVFLAVEGFLPPTAEAQLSTPALAGIISGCIGFILIMLAIYIITYCRHKRQIKEYREIYFQRTGESDYKLDPDRTLLEQCNDLQYDHDFEFPEERLIIGKILGQGAFGQVLRAEAIGMATFNPRDKSAEAVKLRSRLRRSMRKSKKGNDYNSMRTTRTTVAIKCLKEGASQSDYKDLASELKILIHVGEHKNIVNILGACTKGRRLMVIIEFAPYGNLLNFLRERREVFEPTWTKTSNDPERDYTLVDLAMATYQISKGVEFLASKKCVHRDLAARNVLVGPDYMMKVSDFGLARDIYQDDLYVKNTSGLLPVKWMALESLFDRVYTEKTDVWSFGILLWEIFTLGGTPYPGLPTEQLLDYLSEGQRMAQPQNCPLEIYTIMRDCWMQLPDQRPTFATLADRLGKVLERNVAKDNPYIQLIVDEDTGTTDYYLTPCDGGQQRKRNKTPDGYEEPIPTSHGEPSTRYDSPLPSLPPNMEEESDEDIANSPLPVIPPSYDEATSRPDGKRRSSSLSSNESGIDMNDKSRRAEAERLLVDIPNEHGYYNEVSGNGKGKGKGKKRLESLV